MASQSKQEVGWQPYFIGKCNYFTCQMNAFFGKYPISLAEQ
jgi:hypothetical protein